MFISLLPDDQGLKLEDEELSTACLRYVLLFTRKPFSYLLILYSLILIMGKPGLPGGLMRFTRGVNLINQGVSDFDHPG